MSDRIAAVVDSVLCSDGDRVERDVRALQNMAEQLFERKQTMLGSKNETTSLVAEILFNRMRRGVRAFLDDPEPAEEVRVAERILGSLLAQSAMGELAIAVDRAILEGSAPRDYSFAGRADFISLEEVMQLLGAGKHQGCLSLEKADNRIDIYLRNGTVAFLDPHRMARRVLPGTGQNYREIPLEAIEEAEKLHSQRTTPIFLTLQEKGHFRDLEIRSAMRQLGGEILFEFLRSQGETSFFYRRLDELPDYAAKYDLRLGVTPILLEGSKRLDDWRSMVRVFPEPDQPLQPVPDMFARIASLDLGVLEIKMLAQINGETTPNTLVASMGLPLHDVYQYLVRFAREGVLVPPGGMQALHDLSMSVEESMKMAFEALDANDDEAQIGSALDRVLGDDGSDSPFGGGGALGALGALGNDEAPRSGLAARGSEKFDLDFLRSAHDDDD